MAKWIEKTLKLETNERKNLAIVMMFGGCIVFTIYASVTLFLVANNPSYVFLLGVIAHGQIFSILAGFIAQLVKRRVAFTKEGIKVTDLDETLKYLAQEENNPHVRRRRSYNDGFDNGPYGNFDEGPYEGRFESNPYDIEEESSRGNRIGIDLDWTFDKNNESK